MKKAYTNFKEYTIIVVPFVIMTLFLSGYSLPAANRNRTFEHFRSIVAELPYTAEKPNLPSATVIYEEEYDFERSVQRKRSVFRTYSTFALNQCGTVDTPSSYQPCKVQILPFQKQVTLAHPSFAFPLRI